MKIKTYDIMNLDEKIAEFRIEDSESITFMEIYAEDIQKLPLSLKAIFEYYNTDTLDYDKVFKWFERRVTPKTQEGVEEKLKILGMTEYSVMELIFSSNAISPRDHAWIKFHEGDTFRDVHPLAPYIYGEEDIGDKDELERAYEEAHRQNIK